MGEMGARSSPPGYMYEVYGATPYTLMLKRRSLFVRMLCRPGGTCTYQTLNPPGTSTLGPVIATPSRVISASAFETTFITFRTYVSGT